MTLAGTALYLFEASGMKALMRAVASLKLLGGLGDLVQLAPSIDPPFFFSQIGKTFPAQGEKQHRVAFLAGCLANVAFARLNEATVRVLQKNGCEVVVPSGQGCCGALHLHAGLREGARALARRNVDALLGGEYDAIVTNAGGCGSTLKEYGELLADDPAYAAKARDFAGRVRDVTEFLASIELNPAMKRLDAVVTYQDSCHLAHAQHIRSAPRKLLSAVPGVTLHEIARGRPVLRQRGHLQCHPQRHGDAGAGEQDGSRERDRRFDSGIVQPGLHAATAGRGAAARRRAEGDARGGDPGPGVQERGRRAGREGRSVRGGPAL